MASKYSIDGSLLNACCHHMSFESNSWRDHFSTPEFRPDSSKFIDSQEPSDNYYYCLADTFKLKDGSVLPRWGHPYCDKYTIAEGPIKLASVDSVLIPQSSRANFQFEFDHGHYFSDPDRLTITVAIDGMITVTHSSQLFSSKLAGRWLIIDVQGHGGKGGNGMYSNPLFSSSYQCGGGGGGSGAYVRVLIDVTKCPKITAYRNLAGTNLGFYDSSDTSIANLAIEDGSDGGDGSTANNSGYRGVGGSVIRGNKAIEQDTSSSFGDRDHVLCDGVYLLSCLWGVDGTSGVVVRGSDPNATSDDTDSYKSRKYFDYNTYETIENTPGYGEKDFGVTEGGAAGGGGAPSPSSNGRSHPNSDHSSSNGEYGSGGCGSSAWRGADENSMLGGSAGKGYIALIYNIKS